MAPAGSKAAVGNSVDFAILEGLRGIAAFLVVLNHARGNLFVGGAAYLRSLPEPTWADRLLIALFQLTSLGPQAVIVFFVLSGFSIAYAVERSGSARSFYARRALRLYPPYLGGLLLAWVAYSLFVAFPVPGVKNLVSVFQDVPTTVANLLYVRSGSFIAQYWSLAHEVIFYALAPVVAIRKFQLSFSVVASIGYVIGWILLVPTGERTIPAAFAFDYVIYFVVGVLAFHHRDIVSRHLSMGKTWFYAWSATGLVGVIVLARVSDRASFMVAAAFSLLALANFLEHRIHNRVLEALGAMSYTLYVTHFAAIFIWGFIANKIGLTGVLPSANPWFWTTAIPFCLVVSALFYLLFERPALQLLRSSRTKRAAQIPGMSASLQR